MSATKTALCAIVSAEGALFSGDIVWMTIMGSQGELGIKPGHAPLLTEIMPGPVHVRCDDGQEHVFYLSGGYLEILPNEIRVLADTALRAQDLDEVAAEKVRQQASKSLLTQQGEFDYSRAAAQLAEAVAQLRTLKQVRKMKR